MHTCADAAHSNSHSHTRAIYFVYIQLILLSTLADSDSLSYC